MPRVALAAALLFCLIPLFPASAAAGTVTLSPIAGVPSSSAPGDRIVPRGKVAIRGRGSRRVTLVAQLRGEGTKNTIARRRLRLVRGLPRRYRLPATVPARGLPAGTYRLRVCARARGRKARCRSRLLNVVPTYVAPTPTPSATATATTSATATPTATPTTSPFTPGAETLGDELFPALGNGGYDTQRYELTLTYLPPSHTLSGTATMLAQATQPLSRLSLDFRGFAVSAVTVDGAAASYERSGDKLRVTPAAGIPQGTPFTVAVTYAGVPPVIVDPDKSTEGFLKSPDGAFVVGEPMGSMGWFPNNNHPTDKASLKVSMTVPAGVEVVGNGDLEADTTNGLLRTVVWNQDEPMSTYLATATIGEFDIATRSVGGLTYYDAEDVTQNAGPGVALEPQMVALLASKYGPYPWSIMGSIVDLYPSGYALETNTKPIYPSGSAASIGTVGHEVAHQWFGNSVTPAQWRDIWLNEGFASYLEWVIIESRGGTSVDDQFADVYARPADDSFWDLPPADPASGADLFKAPMYDRGGATLVVLRRLVGQATFDEILRRWATDNAYDNASTEDLVALAESVHGGQLDAFFQDWLYDADKPTITGAPRGSDRGTARDVGSRDLR